MNNFNKIQFMNLFNEFNKIWNFNFNLQNQNNNFNFMNMSNNINGSNMNNNLNDFNMNNNLNGFNMNNNNNINCIFRRKNENRMKLNRNISDINMDMNNNLNRMNMNMNNNINFNKNNMNMNNNLNFNNINNMNMNNNLNFNKNNMNNLRYNYTFQDFNCLNNNNFNNSMNKFPNRCIMNNLKINVSNNNFNIENNINSLSNQFQNLNLNNNMNCNNNFNFNKRNFFSPVSKRSSPNLNMINFNQANNFCINNNINNINNINISNNNNNQITMKFSFFGNLVILVKAKLRERFCDVIKRFKENDCPQDLRDDLSVALHGGDVIKDRNQTLSELDIKDGDIILFILKNKKEKNKTYGNKAKTLKLSEDERIQVKKWLIEYKKKKYINEMVNNPNLLENNKNLLVLNNRESLYNFMEFIREKERQGFIKVKEHKHKLVYCLTIFDWQCNLCNRNYNKENGRYYCSICNFNMCDNCHSKGEYIKKKAFPEGVKPTNKMVNKKYFKTDYHDHRLVYCRSSRSVIGYNGWICDNCRDHFDNDVWSFFCTNCDFDLCCSCLGYNS